MLNDATYAHICVNGNLGRCGAINAAKEGDGFSSTLETAVVGSIKARRGKRGQRGVTVELEMMWRVLKAGGAP